MPLLQAGRRSKELSSDKRQNNPDLGLSGSVAAAIPPIQQNRSRGKNMTQHNVMNISMISSKPPLITSADEMNNKVVHFQQEQSDDYTQASPGRQHHHQIININTASSSGNKLLANAATPSHQLQQQSNNSTINVNILNQSINLVYDRGNANDSTEVLMPLKTTT